MLAPCARKRGDRLDDDRQILGVVQVRGVEDRVEAGDSEEGVV